jgi:hypothetical protein
MSNITPSPKPSDSTASEQESSNHIHSGSELLQRGQSPSGDVTHLLQRLNTGSFNDDSDQQQHNDALLELFPNCVIPLPIHHTPQKVPHLY